MRHIRLMTQDDVQQVLHIQAQCYRPLTLEGETTIRARLDSAPDSAWVAEDDAGVCAYLVAYRSMVGKVTPLDGLFAPAHAADSLYLHDLAVSPRVNGQGVGPALVACAWESAQEQGLTHSSLVSVQDSRAFWARLGYAVWDGLDELQRARLQTYEAPSWYMVKRVGQVKRAAV